MNRFFISTLAVMFATMACGTETSTDQSSGSDVDPYGDPPGYTGDPFAGYGPITSISFPVEQEIPSPQESTGSWSVQVAACATEAAASDLAEAVSRICSEPVFIDHIGSYYKVRVGAFETADETAELRSMLRSGGYGDAWSVERETTP